MRHYSLERALHNLVLIVHHSQLLSPAVMVPHKTRAHNSDSQPETPELLRAWECYSLFRGLGDDLTQLPA